MAVGIERFQGSFLETLRRKPKRLVFEELPPGSTVWETGEVTPPEVKIQDEFGFSPRGIRVMDPDTISINHGALVGSEGYNIVREYTKEEINSIRPSNPNVPRPVWRP